MTVWSKWKLYLIAIIFLIRCMNNSDKKISYDENSSWGQFVILDEEENYHLRWI